MSATILPFLRSAPADPRADFHASARLMLAAFWRLADADPSAARWAMAEVTTEMLGILDQGDGS